MKAITTKYIGATDTKPSRIKASASGECSITIPYEGEFDGDGAFRKAADALCAKYDWNPKGKHYLASGGTETGFVFVFVPVQEAKPEKPYMPIKDRPSIGTIYDSIVNGQFDQAHRQATEYGLYDIFRHYRNFLCEFGMTGIEVINCMEEFCSIISHREFKEAN